MTWKMATFNVNGIRARQGILLDWLTEHRPDAICLQETKCQDKDFPVRALEEAGYHPVFKGQKSYNGVATLTLTPPVEVRFEFGDGGPEDEARFLALRTEHLWLVNTYVPQGRSPEDPAFPSKLGFLARVRTWFETLLSPGTPLIWTGDLNVAPEEIDVFDPKRLAGQTGFHPEERKALARAAAWGLTDLFRHLNPETRQFTFWDYRLPQSLERNLGWRLDHIMVTDPLLERALTCRVDPAPRALPKPSDHTPVWAEFDLERLRTL